MAASFRCLVHASELLTGAGIRRKDGRKPTDSDLDSLADGALVYSTRKVGKRVLPDRIEWVGPTSKLPKRFLRAKRQDLKNRHALVPGFVDCHNHLVFAGDRSNEFAERCAGATYEQIAAKGGGILTTVRATRNATLAELERIAIPRVKEAMSYGIRTLEVKSGYGLTFESELKVLEVVQRLRKRFPEITFSPTFLGAHAFPPASERSREDYLRDLIETMLPEVKRRGLADACDVFIDKGYYTLEEGERILKAAKALGFAVKVHADELGNTESASLAARLGSLSADHLLQISDRGIRDLARSQTVAVLLPGTAFYLKADYAPARKLIEAGAAVALSTDFNPGTCVTLSLPTIMTIAALYLKMSRAEIFAAVTYNAAKALGLHAKKGTLEAGKDADFNILPFARFEETYYRFAWSPLAAPKAR